MGLRPESAGIVKITRSAGTPEKITELPAKITTFPVKVTEQGSLPNDARDRPSTPAAAATRGLPSRKRREGRLIFFYTSLPFHHPHVCTHVHVCVMARDPDNDHYYNERITSTKNENTQKKNEKKNAQSKNGGSKKRRQLRRRRRRRRRRLDARISGALSLLLPGLIRWASLAGYPQDRPATTVTKWHDVRGSNGATLSAGRRRKSKTNIFLRSLPCLVSDALYNTRSMAA